VTGFLSGQSAKASLGRCRGPHLRPSAGAPLGGAALTLPIRGEVTRVSGGSIRWLWKRRETGHMIWEVLRARLARPVCFVESTASGVLRGDPRIHRLERCVPPLTRCSLGRGSPWHDLLASDGKGSR
jgi:hypothetical protein